ncbi:hypothetical protein MNB_SV-14-1033 [hydrothermal vent metagenome]|uniref:Uncharacterized protein n=1 Tax=hydrothermal vent metagenome TaxID=652676 RepID=A0A1W1CD09_9ZZZZ
MSKVTANALLSNDEVILQIKKLKDDFVSEMRKKYENAKNGIGLDDLPDFLLKTQYKYSEDFTPKALWKNNDNIDVVKHHIEILNNFQKKIDEIRENSYVIKDSTSTNYSVDIDYGDEYGEIEEYCICYEYDVLVADFDAVAVESHAKEHISNYVKEVLYEGTGASYRMSVSCADINALLDGEITIDTLRKIKYEICDVSKNLSKGGKNA